MANHYIAQVRIPSDGGLPRDDVCINPCFRINGLLEDVDGLAEDLANGIHNKLVGQLRPVTVKIYDLENDPPNYPEGQFELNKGSVAPAAQLPREIAVCLSFYGEHNRPRNRGRLYIPWFCMTTDSSSLAKRPGTTVRSNVGSLADVFADLGGLNVDWIVWSRINKTATKVQNWFVDDEWDIVRRRGLRPTTRLTGTTSG